MTLAIIFGETKRNKKPPFRATNTGLRSCWFSPFLCLSSHSLQSGLLLVQLEATKLSQWILWKCLLSRKKIFIWMLESNGWNSRRHNVSGKNSKHLFSLSRSFFWLASVSSSTLLLFVYEVEYHCISKQEDFFLLTKTFCQVSNIFYA